MTKLNAEDNKMSARLVFGVESLPFTNRSRQNIIGDRYDSEVHGMVSGP